MIGIAHFKEKIAEITHFGYVCAQKKIVNNYLSSKTQKYKLSLLKNQNFNSKNEKKNAFDDCAHFTVSYY